MDGISGICLLCEKSMSQKDPWSYSRYTEVQSMQIHTHTDAHTHTHMYMELLGREG